MFSVAVYILLYATVSLFSKPFLGEFIKVFVAIIVSEVYPSVSDAPQTTSSLLALTETVPLNTTLYERPFARVISFVDLLYEKPEDKIKGARFLLYLVQTPVNIIDTQECVNVILAHNYYKFNNTKLPNFGTATILDTMSDWYGADLLICGHIHKRMEFDGYITKDDMAHECHVEYPGCMARPAYQEGMMDTEGVVIVIEVFDDNTIDVSKEIVTLWDLSESFNLGAKALEKAKQAEKENRVDISDVVKQLDAHDRNVGNPEDMIMSLDGVDTKYKDKAIALLKEALG